MNAVDSSHQPNRYALCIEDAAAIHPTNLAAYLADTYGIQTAIEHDGLSAIIFARQRRPAFIVLDRMLPDLDGLEVFRHVRMEFGAGVPIFMLSGDQTPAAIEVAREAGVNHYLNKPLDFESLSLAIQAVLPDVQGKPTDGADKQNKPNVGVGMWNRIWPEDILPILRDVPREKWANRLADILRDRDSSSRGAAVVALAAWGREVNAPFNHTEGQRFFWEYVRESLADSTPDDAQARWTPFALFAYALMHAPGKLDEKLAFVMQNSKNATIRRWSLRILLMNRVPVTIDLALHSLSDPSEQVRAMAALALATLATPQHIPVLLEALNDPLPLVREAVANTLAYSAGSLSQTILETALLNGAPNGAASAANALSVMGTPDAVESLLTSVEVRTETVVLCQVAHALGKIKTNKCRVALWKLNKHEDELIQKTAKLYI